MASSSSLGGAVPDKSFIAMARDQQASSSKICSNESSQKKTNNSIPLDQQQLLKKLCGSRGRNRGRILPSFNPVGDSQHTAATSPTLLSRRRAPPSIPEIRVKGADPGDAPTDASGSVSPSNHPQSADHLQVPTRSRPRAQHKRPTVQPGGGSKRTFLGSVDRALGLHHVRTIGDHEPVIDSRYRAKRNTFRIIALFGVSMMLSLAASIVLFVYFASKGTAGPEWFAWIGISAVGWIWSFLALIMAKQSKRRVLHDVEIAQQSILLNSRVREGTVAPIPMIGGLSANKQQVIGARSDAAADGVASVVLGKHPGLEPIQEEDWARDAEERLDMLVANQRRQSRDE
ncbi:hypothetical protein LZ32DRAFT_682057 [Colletotrichum eremochloae]|nr:hypothetical protein LZ32DRAFT_682057 [Colletotrichum eremochloae]